MSHRSELTAYLEARFTAETSQSKTVHAFRLTRGLTAMIRKGCPLNSVTSVYAALNLPSSLDRQEGLG